MKAAVLHQAGTALAVEETPGPQLRPSGVRIRVLATHILSFTDQVVGGQSPFPLPTPYIPGLSAVGAIEALADDVFGLRIGQRVFCSPLISSRNIQDPESILKGWFGITMNCGPLLEQWKDGAFAQSAVYPVECVTPIDSLAGYGDAETASIYYLSIAYGALLRGELTPGQSVLVNGATGNLGSASVLMALAMGASRIFAVGRNSDVLHSLAALDPKRVTAVSLPDRVEDYHQRVSAEINGVDLMIDAVGVLNHSTLVEAGLSILRHNGTAVFLGGVATNVQLSYLTTLVKGLNIRGSFMYPLSAPSDITKMIESGLVNLKAFEPQVYSLDQINEAIAAASNSRGLRYVVLQP